METIILKEELLPDMRNFPNTLSFSRTVRHLIVQRKQLIFFNQNTSFHPANTLAA